MDLFVIQKIKLRLIGIDGEARNYLRIPKDDVRFQGHVEVACRKNDLQNRVVCRPS